MYSVSVHYLYLSRFIHNFSGYIAFRSLVSGFLTRLQQSVLEHNSPVTTNNRAIPHHLNIIPRTKLNDNRSKYFDQTMHRCIHSLISFLTILIYFYTVQN